MHLSISVCSSVLRPRTSGILKVVSSLPVLAALLCSCAEQPVGYIFTPTQRDQVSLARTTVEMINALYSHTDQAAGFLDAAALTTDYSKILPEGWDSTLAVDPDDGTPYTLYLRNYLDKDFYFLRFDSDPMRGSVRSPSDLEYQFYESRSFQNVFTSDFYSDINEGRELVIEYTDGRQDPLNVDGWFNMWQSVAFEEEVDIGGQAGSYSYSYYLRVYWMFRIQDFSIDARDQRSRIVIDGTFPVYDEAGDYRQPHVSGEITIESNGSGRGEMYMYGEPMARLHFTARTAGFEGYFTLHREEHRKRYSL